VEKKIKNKINLLKMKKYFFLLLIIFPLIFNECKAENQTSSLKTNTTGNTVVKLTNETFKKMVFNYDINKEWKFEGNKPAIIDFYADWCPPCRQLSPLVEEIAKEYSGKIDVYKVDTDKETTLAQALGIANLPTLLFIPAKGKPQITMGAIPKDSLVKAIYEILLIK
jgi:thioredoxin 1